MYFIKDNKNKIVFGWSAKCGCSHVKMIFQYLIKNTINFKIRHKNTYNKLGSIDDSYTIILFIRNPFIRLVSGFNEKYKKGGQLRHLWRTNKVLNFKNFVDKVVNKSEFIDKHHFTPQLSEAWSDKIYSHKNLIIYDIKNIDYKFLENLYKKKIPKIILDYRGEYRTSVMKNKEIILKVKDNIKVYNLASNKIKNGARYEYKLYYTEDIKNKVLSFYKKDFEFFKKHGFNYTV
tara:strand:+ start:92 stop:790 length:699 start_codon:yes stop_codon:yes gene_type:complete